MEKKKRILLVDDEDVILFGFSRVLAEPGIEIDSAQTAEEALEFIAINRYAAAIIDLGLSNATPMEGFDIVGSLKSLGNGCKIIVLTAYGEDDIKEHAFRDGADFFFEKPVDPETIKKLLRAEGVY